MELFNGVVYQQIELCTRLYCISKSDFMTLVLESFYKLHDSYGIVPLTEPEHYDHDEVMLIIPTLIELIGYQYTLVNYEKNLFDRMYTCLNLTTIFAHSCNPMYPLLPSLTPPVSITKYSRAVVILFLSYIGIRMKITTMFNSTKVAAVEFIALTEEELTVQRTLEYNSLRNNFGRNFLRWRQDEYPLERIY